MKKALLTLLAVLLVSTLAACGSKSSAGETKHVKIGVTGSDGQMWDIIKEKAEKEGIEIELVEFSDYTLPNQALANGDIDLNAFQHIAFLNQFKEEHKLELTPIGTTQIAPMGIYSEKVKSVDEIKDGAEIAIPNDPTNQARALKVLELAGLLELKEDFSLFGDPSGIARNPKNLKITPINAQQTPRVLKDVAASIINNGVAGQAGFVPTEDAIFLEDPNQEDVKPYINIIAARSEDKDNKTFKKIVEIYHEKEVVEAIKKDTNGGSLVVDIPIEELKDVIK
jgi:D-methionine transport system substrate-binding protein